MVDWTHCRKFMTGIAAVLAMTLCLSACEPLRKKFTRQKKKAQAESADFIPVLEPQEYLPPEYNPQENYKQHYVLVKVWYRDLWTVLEEKGADKKARYTLKQIYGHIAEMQKLLVEEKRPLLDKLTELLKYFDDSLSNPPASRNIARIQSDLRAFDRLLRAQLRADKLNGHFVEPPKPS